MVLARLGATPDCLLARMSGSGGTCFGLFADEAAAAEAARAIAHEIIQAGGYTRRIWFTRARRKT